MIESLPIASSAQSDEALGANIPPAPSDAARDGLRPRESRPVQAVLILDLQDSVPTDTFAEHLPGAAESRTLYRLSAELELELPIRTPPDATFPFPEVGRAVKALVRRARAECSHESPEWFVVGKAPLPVFALLGYELSAWARPVTLLNQRKDGEWDLLRLGADGPLGSSPLQARMPETEQVTTGRVALFVSTMSADPPVAEIQSYVTGRGDHLGGIAAVSGKADLDSENARAIAQQVAEAFSGIRSAFPLVSESGCALFVAGPASLAFIAGRAINPNILPPSWAPNFFRGAYIDAFDLPFEEQSRPAIDESKEAGKSRTDLWDAIRTAYGELQRDIIAADLNGHPLVRSPEALQDALSNLQFPEKPTGSGFRLRILEGDLELGHPFLAALLPLGEEAAIGVAKQLLVHELFHYAQNLTYANYVNIGRSDYALEEIDYWADCFAIEALSKLSARLTGAPIIESVKTELGWVLCGIACFDRAEHGARIENLAERRLRRYLIWGLQRARADTLREERDVEALLRERLVAVLSPLSGSLDSRGDKVVARELQDTELVVTCGGALARTSAGLDAAELVELVRSMSTDKLTQALSPAVTNERLVLAPWAPAP